MILYLNRITSIFLFKEQLSKKELNAWGQVEISLILPANFIVIMMLCKAKLNTLFLEIELIKWQ